jgi:HlyD family secretion protein
MSVEAIAPPIPSRKISRLVFVLPMVVVLGLCAYLVIRKINFGAGAASNDVFYRVVPMDLELAIKKDGELKAIENLDVVCPVEGLNTITTIVPEGKLVKKGDVICELDSSEIKRKLQQATLDVKKAESDLTAAKEQLAIQESKNKSDLEAAQVELKLAQIDLQGYEKVDYPAKLQAAKKDAEMAEITVRDKQEAKAQQQQLLSKAFVTTSDVKSAEVELIKAQTDLEKKQSDLSVLVEYTHEKDLADKKNKVAQGEGKVERTKSENNSNLAQKVADAQTKEQSLILYKETEKHLQEQLASCTIKAPGDGIVIYGSSDSWYYRDTPIQAGAKVSEQQLIVRLPDTSRMKVIAKIGETQAQNLKIDKAHPLRATVKIVGVAEEQGAWVSQISILPDNSNRWWGSENKEYPADITLDKTPPGLKPGLSASVQIHIETLKNVLAAPLAAIYSSGADSYVFVKRSEGSPKPVKVKVGKTTDTHAELASGVSAGDDIVVLQMGQGRQLLEAAGISDTPTTQPTDKATTPAKSPQLAAK